MAEDRLDELETQIESRSAEIFTDSYSMSIGELSSMYRESELDIHPEFQRFYRWDDTQKTSLIESLLLGIPIPPIFIAQRPDGVWDVIDGLQRLSTIFEFMGVLADEEENLLEPLELEATRYLSALKGIVWEDEQNPSRALTDAQRRIFKREKLQMVIIKHQSDDETKYELFQRLNTGGSQLSDQELRNCILVNLNRDFYNMLEDLAKDEAFARCVPLTEKQKNERYDLELVLRFVVFRRADPGKLQNIDVGRFLTNQMIELCMDPAFDVERERATFKCTFELIDRAAGDDAFRPWDSARGRGVGAFSLSAYEVVAFGLGFHCDDGFYEGDEAQLQETMHAMWNNPEYTKRSGSGKKASWRLPHLIPLGRRLFGNDAKNV